MKIGISKYSISNTTDMVKNLFENNNKKLYNSRMYNTQSLVWQDMCGLSWIFINDEEI